MPSVSYRCDWYNGQKGRGKERTTPRSDLHSLFDYHKFWGESFHQVFETLWVFWMWWWRRQWYLCRIVETTSSQSESECWTWRKPNRKIILSMLLPGCSTPYFFSLHPRNKGKWKVFLFFFLLEKKKRENFWLWLFEKRCLVKLSFWESFTVWHDNNMLTICMLTFHCQ